MRHEKSNTKVYKNLAGAVYPQYKWPGGSRREMSTLRDEREVPTSLSSPFVLSLAVSLQSTTFRPLEASLGLSDNLVTHTLYQTGTAPPDEGEAQLAIWFIRFVNFGGKLLFL